MRWRCAATSERTQRERERAPEQVLPSIAGGRATHAKDAEAEHQSAADDERAAGPIKGGKEWARHQPASWETPGAPQAQNVMPRPCGLTARSDQGHARPCDARGQCATGSPPRSEVPLQGTVARFGTATLGSFPSGWCASLRSAWRAASTGLCSGPGIDRRHVPAGQRRHPRPDGDVPAARHGPGRDGRPGRARRLIRREVLAPRAAATAPPKPVRHRTTPRRSRWRGAWWDWTAAPAAGSPSTSSTARWPTSRWSPAWSRRWRWGTAVGAPMRSRSTSRSACWVPLLVTRTWPPARCSRGARPACSAPRLGPWWTSSPMTRRRPTPPPPRSPSRSPVGVSASRRSGCCRGSSRSTRWSRPAPSWPRSTPRSPSRCWPEARRRRARPRGRGWRPGSATSPPSASTSRTTSPERTGARRTTWSTPRSARTSPTAWPEPGTWSRVPDRTDQHDRGRAIEMIARPPGAAGAGGPPGGQVRR